MISANDTTHLSTLMSPTIILHRLAMIEADRLVTFLSIKITHGCLRPIITRPLEEAC